MRSCYYHDGCFTITVADDVYYIRDMDDARAIVYAWFAKDAAYEAPCPNCGYKVGEDAIYRRCMKCGRMACDGCVHFVSYGEHVRIEGFVCDECL